MTQELEATTNGVSYYLVHLLMTVMVGVVHSPVSPDAKRERERPKPICLGP